MKCFLCKSEITKEFFGKIGRGTLCNVCIGRAYDLYRAVETTARDLPPGYEVVLSIENGGYAVEVEYDEGTLSVESVGDVSGDIEEATRCAIGHYAENHQPCQG